MSKEILLIVYLRFITALNLRSFSTVMLFTVAIYVLRKKSFLTVGICLLLVAPAIQFVFYLAFGISLLAFTQWDSMKALVQRRPSEANFLSEIYMDAARLAALIGIYILAFLNCKSCPPFNSNVNISLDQYNYELKLKRTIEYVKSIMNKKVITSLGH